MEGGEKVEISGINLINSISSVSSQNQQSTSTSNSSNFKNTLHKLSSSNSSSKTEVTPAESKENLQSSKSVQDDGSLQTISSGNDTVDEKLKNAILDAAKAEGFSEDDLAKIKKLLEDNTNIQQLLLMLSQNTNGTINIEEMLGKNNINDILKEIDNVLSSKLDSADILKLKDKLSSELSNLNLNQLLSSENNESNNSIKTLIEKAVNDLGIKVSNDDLKSLSNNIENNVLNLLSENAKSNITNVNAADGKDIIKNYLMKLLQAADAKNTNANNGDLQTNLIQLNGKTQQENNNTIVNSSETKQQSASDKNSKDESFLNNLVAKDSKSSSTNFSRVTNFINQLTNSNTASGTVSVENANPVLNANNLQDDFIQNLKFMSTNDMQQLTVKIVPKELGEVVINLTLEGGNLKASITAANKDAYNLLNANLPDINNKLQNENIKIQNLTLNVYSDDTTFFKDGSQNQRQERGNSKDSSIQNVNLSDSQDILNNNLSEEINNVNLFA
ncbi:MAG: fliK [Clostridiaceae bacterium]|jgi:flagellar hook-length control protein FliK|nr:fliK [Clostridiaceae bacterium]